MNLYAVYVDGVLLDQMPAETEDSCFAKLKLEYPKIKGDEITFQVIDADYQTERKEVVVDSAKEEVKTAPKGPIVILETASLEINITIKEGSISAEEIKKLEEAAETGMVVARKKN